MNRSWRFLLAIALAVPALAVLPQCALAQIKVMTSGGFAAPLRKLLPEFQKSTGISVELALGKSQGSSPDTIGAQLGRGVPADVVVLSREGLDDLISEKKVVAGSDINLAQAPLGVAVGAGAPKPDISTVDAFKNSLLQARAITYPSSTTGIYMVTKLFPKLGISNQVAGKSSNLGVAAVVKGDAEIAIQPVSELLHVPGTDFVGTIPAEIQYISVFSAAVVAGSNNIKAARQLIAFLTSEKAKNAIRDSGMDPQSAGGRRN
jgi:molybdate transport system substrate-binding protein